LALDGEGGPTNHQRGFFEGLLLMLLTNARQHRMLMQLADALLACVAFVVSFSIRDYLIADLPVLSGRDIGAFDAYLFFLPILALASPLVLHRLEFYSLSVNQNRPHVVNLALQGALVLFLIMVVAQFFLKEQMSRLVFVLFVPCYTALLFGREMVARAWRIRSTRAGANQRALVVVSDRPGSTSWKEQIAAHPEYGFRVAREMPLDELLMDEFLRVLHNEAVELAIFDIQRGSFQRVTDLIQACEQEGIEVWLTSGFIETRVAQMKLESFGGAPILVFRSTPDSSWQLLLKALIDRTVAALALVLAAPLLGLIALAIRLTSPGPVLFSQERSGLYGRPFRMFKFRSMTTNAEQTRQELAQLNEMSGPVFKLTNDPRVTPVGRWLRAWSLDELPQLWNVLKGEMSLVGPRPLPVYETLAMSENAQRRRLSVKPGITCLWQVSGRNNVTDFKDWVRMDLEYIDRWSLWLDFKILLQTVPAVLLRKGAK
jgi:exopolysaccharide biosynthesis polyprenyl glycosylphosphotransferase